MNTHSFLIAVFGFTIICITSCSTEGGGNGQVINNPSVEDMARLENQWGMQPRQVKPRLRQADPSDSYTPTYSAPSTPQSSTPAPLAPQPVKELPTTTQVAPAANPSNFPQLR